MELLLTILCYLLATALMIFAIWQIRKARKQYHDIREEYRQVREDTEPDWEHLAEIDEAVSMYETGQEPGKHVTRCRSRLGIRSITPRHLPTNTAPLG